MLAVSAALTLPGFVVQLKEAPAVAAPYCGAALPRPGGGYWTCVMAEEFNGLLLNTARWSRVTTAASGLSLGGDCFTSSSKNITVANGTLRLISRKETAPITCSSPYGAFSTRFTSGMVSTRAKVTWTYGRFEIRAKFPPAKVAGLHSALWLWPQNASYYGAFPASGEIDIAEFFTRYPDRVIPYLHYQQSGPDPNVTNNWCLVSRPEDFHTYVLEWTPTQLKVMFDGVTCLLNTAWTPQNLTMPAPFDRPFFLNLTQAMGIGTNAHTSLTPLPATTFVDYVRVWS